MRTYDAAALRETMEPYLPIDGFTPEGWLSHSENICLTDGDGNFALFEHSQARTYLGHYYFKARGKKAASLSKKFLEEIFSLGAEILIGLTPLTHKGALRLSEHVGFTPVEIVDTEIGEHQLFIMTKKEFYGRDLR